MTPPARHPGRLPFLPLAIAAAAGILAAAVVDPWFCAWAGAAMLAGAFVLARLRGAPWLLLAGVALAFAAMQGWRDSQSPARDLARAWPGPVVATFEGRVREVPRETPAGRARFTAWVERMELPGWEGPLRLPLLVDWPGAPPRAGDRVRVTGTLTAIRPPRNPGAFDFAAFMRRQGIFSNLRANAPQDVMVLASPFGPNLLEAAAAAREWIRQTLLAGLDPESPQSHAIVGMTIGDTRPLDESTLEEFRKTGTFHLFSVSGLHVGILGVLLWMVLAALGVPPRIAATVIIPALFFYALLTGWKPASVRAATMAAFVLAGMVAGRPPLVLNSLLGAAFLILLFDPGELFNPGFQLSFTVVTAIVLLVPRLDPPLRKTLAVDPLIPRRLRTPSERAREAAADAVVPLAAVAIAAWVGSLPLTLGLFHLLPLAAVPANMVCVPLAFVAMALAVTSLCAGVFSMALAAVFNNANWAVASLLLAAVDLFAGIPGSAFYVGGPHALAGADPRLTVFDFGSGQSALLESDRRKWLLDTGPAREADRTLVPALRAAGAGSLDGVILTHGDAGHAGAALRLLEACPPRRIIVGPLSDRSSTRNAFFREIAERGIGKSVYTAGETLRLSDSAVARVLYPPPGIRRERADDKALVLALEVRGWRILMMSDAGPATEAWLLEHQRDALRCDALIRGTHGSGVATDAAFLEAASPRLVIAASSGHPPQARLRPEDERAIARIGASLLRLDQHGAIILRFGGNDLVAKGFASGETFRIPRVDSPARQP